jgi:hypothetical protein
MHAKRMDLLLSVFSSDDVFGVTEFFSSQVDVIVIDSWHVLMFGDKLDGCICNHPPPRK